MIPRARTLRSALAAIIIVILVAAPSAQQAPQFAAAAAPAATPREPGDTTTDIDLLVGRSTILNVGSPISRVSLTVPDVADAMVTAPNQLLIHGKAPGTISLFVWDRGGAIKTFEVRVRRDLTALAAQLRQLFPGEAITAVGSGKDVVLSGTVSGQYVVDKAATVAGGYVEKKENVVNLLKQQEGVASNQVMLRVRFAEVSRSAIQELGASLFTGPTGYKDVIARSSTQQFAAPNFTELNRTAIGGKLATSDGKYSLSDFLNLFVFSNKYNIGAVVRALQEKGLFQSLAEPNLIATNGKEASFLAGGEFPYPVVQGGSNSNSVSIMFKEFGIRLNFTPTVLGGDLINLKVRPEVSSLDFGNAVTVSGFRVPSLTTRRAETEVELRDGQTFAIAGLMSNSVQDSMRKIPGIGEIPILGWLFKSKAMQKAQTELVVMITPTIVRRGQTGVSEGLPSPVEPFLGPPAKTIPNPDPYIGSPRFPANQPAPRKSSENPAAKTPVTATQPAPVARPIQAPVTLPVVADRVAPQPQSAVAPVETPETAAAPVQAPPVEAQPATTPDEAQPATPPAPTKAQLKALNNQRLQEKKAAEEAAKRQAVADKRKAEADKAALKKAEIEHRAADKVAKERAAREAVVAQEQAKREAAAAEERAKREAAIAQERAKRDAEVAKKNAEIARRKAEEDQNRDKVLADAAARLKEAQAAYQAEIDKAQRSSSDKAKKPGTESSPRQ
jgi:pilus assembly protein CpaC